MEIASKSKKYKTTNKKVSPKSYIKHHIYESVPIIKKRKKKVSSDNFTIPTYKEYYLLLELNYNVSQLKTICKNYKLKVSGNKQEKIHRIYNFLKFSYYTTKIQKLYRGYLMRKYIY